MKKGLQTKLALLSLVSVMTVSTVLAAPNYSHGDANVTTSGNVTTITHNKGGVNNNYWNQFNLGKGEKANFVFNKNNTLSVNRVTGNNMSQIYGTIQSSGAGARTSHIILSNPNGILFGAGHQINANAFTATTHDVTTSVNADGDVKVDFQNKSNGKVTVNGGVWNINKSAAIVAKDIEIDKSTIVTKTGIDTLEYKDSALSTANTIDDPNEVIHSNVKLISNDGVTFELKANHGGAIYNKVDPTKVSSSQAHSIKVTNSTIASGSVQMYAGGNKNSDITIKNSAVKGVKLVNFAYGDIALVSKGKVNIQDSNITTAGSYQVIDGKIVRSTFDNKAYDVDGQSINISKDGGMISISGDAGVDIDNTKVITVASDYKDANILNDVAHGGVAITSKDGNINISNNSNISSYGSLYVRAGKDVNINDSSLNAAGIQKAIPGIAKGFVHEKDMHIQGQNIVAKNSQIKANGKINMQATNGSITVANAKTNGIEAKAITMGATKDINVSNAVLKADATSMIAGNNINLDKASVQSYTQGKVAQAYMEAKNGSVATKDSFLKLNNNKLVVRAGKDAQLNLRAAANKNAGVEVYAGKNTTLNAEDGTLSIARIETDTLNLNANNQFIADNNAKTAVDGRAYIQVRQYGGFSLDSKPEYVGKDTKNVKYESYRNEIKDENGNVIAYARHSMTLNGEAPFTLDYKKPVKPEAPDPTRVTYDDLSKLPLQAANPTLASQITNNMTDPASGVIAAAAAVEIEEDEQLDY